MIVVPLHLALAYGGYLICSYFGYQFPFLFGLVIDNYNYAYFSLIMGLLMAIATKPDAHEIKWAQSKD